MDRDSAVVSGRSRAGVIPASQYDYIVCGAGSTGSVVARRLAENPEVQVLLIEAGGSDLVPSSLDPSLWFTNLNTERDWGFVAEPSKALNGRSMPLSMGKALGGGSAINVMVWSRGHRNDWNFYAEESGDPRWSYENVLAVYRRIEDWQGELDVVRRGRGGLVFVQPVPDPNPIAPALLEACAAHGIPTFADQNGAMMEGPGGAALANVRLRPGQRLNLFDTYVRPLLGASNLTGLNETHVRQLRFAGRRVIGVEVEFRGEPLTFGASEEVILSLGAIHTPKLLMASGIGEADELRRLGIGVVADAPEVGRNFQDHIMVASCLWEYASPIALSNNASEATFFWKSDSALDTPDLQPFQIQLPYVNDVTAARYQVPESGWTIGPGLVRPKSRGRVSLTAAAPEAPVRIDAGALTEQADVDALVRCVELCRDIGNSAPLARFSKREVMPGPLSRKAMQEFVRDGAVTYFHQCGTARMGRDERSVVDSVLRVRGVERLRVADASIMPRVPTGNTMAPCVVIGELAAEAIRAAQAE